MGWWKNAVGLMFGSESTVKKTMDMAERGVDKAFWTREEQGDWWLLMLKAYEPFRVAQRLVTMIVGIPFVLIHVLLFCMSFVVLLYTLKNPCALPEKGKPATQCAAEVAEVWVTQQQGWNNNTLGEPFGWIVLFYFGGGATEGAIRTIGGALAARRKKKEDDES